MDQKIDNGDYDSTLNLINRINSFIHSNIMNSFIVVKNSYPKRINKERVYF